MIRNFHERRINRHPFPHRYGLVTDNIVPNPNVTTVNRLDKTNFEALLILSLFLSISFVQVFGELVFVELDVFHLLYDEDGKARESVIARLFQVVLYLLLCAVIFFVFLIVFFAVQEYVRTQVPL